MTDVAVHCKYDELVPVAELRKRVSPKNPNEHSDEQVERLAQLLEFYGWRHAIICDVDSKTIEAGHGRLMAAQHMGATHCPVVYQSFRDDEERYGFMVADNAIQQQWAQLNFAKINLEIPALGPDFQIDMLGLKDFAIDVAEKDADPDAVPEPPKVAKTRRGELWLLGEHRLLVGDSTDKADVERLMAGERAEMMFTDPPYGVDYSGGIQFTDAGVKRESRTKLQNDDSASIYLRALPAIAAAVDGPCYTFFADTKALPVYQAIEAEGEIHSLIVWQKNGGYASMNAHYKQCHEPALYWKPFGSTLRWCGESTERTIWQIDKDGRNEFHPTQKPVALIEKAICNHEAATVIDPFLGSGSTLIACEKTGRRCFGIEIEPLYVDVILSRWAKYTGKDPVREDGVNWSELCAKAGD